MHQYADIKAKEKKKKNQPVLHVWLVEHNMSFKICEYFSFNYFVAFFFVLLFCAKLCFIVLCYITSLKKGTPIPPSPGL